MCWQIPDPMKPRATEKMIRNRLRLARPRLPGVGRHWLGKKTKVFVARPRRHKLTANERGAKAIADQ